MITYLEIMQNDIPYSELKAYFSYITELHDLKQTNQDAIWHSEGNVEIHTSMVIDEVYKVCSDQNITGINRVILVLSALFHDIGKVERTTTKIINGESRVVSPRHEEHGSNRLACVLPSTVIMPEILYAVINIVRFHNIPKLLAIKDSPKSEYIKLSINLGTVSAELLYLFAQCDIKGRICEDEDEQHMYLDYFKEKSIEYNVFLGRYKPNVNISSLNESEAMYIKYKAIYHLIHENIKFDETILAKEYVNKSNHPKLTILMGVSGSGKSTYINNHKFDSVVSLDTIREELSATNSRQNQKMNGQVRQLAKLRIKQSLAKKHNVLYDATNLRADFRGPMVKLGRQYGALVTIIFIHVPIVQLYIQNNNRCTDHIVPNSVLQSQLKDLQYPEAQEADIVKYIFDGEYIDTWSIETINNETNLK